MIIIAFILLTWVVYLKVRHSKSIKNLKATPRIKSYFDLKAERLDRDVEIRGLNNEIIRLRESCKEYVKQYFSLHCKIATIEDDAFERGSLESRDEIVNLKFALKCNNVNPYTGGRII